MAWTTPKTDWDTDDLLKHTDLNEIESNTLHLYNTQNQQAQQPFGFDIYANNATALGGNTNIRVTGGRCFSQSSVAGAINGSFDISKILNSSSWAAGNSVGSPCKAPAATVGSAQWWYVFILYNPVTEAFDVAMDTTRAGSNIAGSSIETVSGFTMWRRIGSLRETAGGALLSCTAMGQWFKQDASDANNSVSQVIGSPAASVGISSLYPPGAAVWFNLEVSFYLNTPFDFTGTELVDIYLIGESGASSGFGSRGLLSRPSIGAASTIGVMYSQFPGGRSSIIAGRESNDGTVTATYRIPSYYDPCDR